MKLGVGRRPAAGLAGAILLATALLSGSTAYAAIPSNAVPFGQADISGYATGTEAHVAAVTVGATTLAEVDQAFSGASTASAGLTKPISNEFPIVVQPAQPASVKAYGMGSGLEVGLGTSPSTAQTDANQILLAGKVQQIAPPNTNPTIKTIGPIGTPGSATAALGPIVQASALTGEGAAIYDAAQCPIGQPISYGLGNAANANVLAAIGAPLVNTAGSGTSTAQSTSETYLAPNADGTWGLASTAANIIAPVSVNLGTSASIQLAVASNGGVNQPVTLTAQTSGESAGSVTASDNDVVNLQLVQGGTHTTILSVPLSAVTAQDHGVVTLSLDLKNLPVTIGQAIGLVQGLASTLPAPLSTLLGTVAAAIQTAATTALVPLTAPLNTIAGVIDLNLGSITIESLPHAIGASPTTPPSPTGTSASGAIDLVNARLGLTVTGTVGGALNLPAISLANINVGHMEASAHTGAPITCSIPVIKVADPSSVTAGNPFTYTIDVPDPAKLGFIDCSLSNMTVTDVISDKDPKAPATFNVTSADVSQGNAPLNVPATITQSSPTSATVSWKGLSWKLGSPPLVFVINVAVPKDSPSGVIQDTATATAVLTGCTGGAAGSGSASAAAAGGHPLTGSYTVQAPAVTAVSVVTPANTPPTAPAAPATALPKNLPFTGAMGGPWQPIGGLAALGLAGGAFALVRRSRRRRPLG